MAEALVGRGRSWTAIARAIEAGDLDKAERLLDGLGEPLAEGDRIASTQAWLGTERQGRRSRFASELKEGCAREGVELRVITKDPLELRLSPLGLLVDFDADHADLVFGRERLARCPARAEAVLAARREALATLEGKGWDPKAFFSALQLAWRRLGEGWVELSEILPELALALQSKRFRQDPTARNFDPYPRVQLIYDLWRLRRDRQLSQGGRRLSLGPATGGSTRDKRRVFWLEDAAGNGQYHLTLRFVAE